jgi:minor fimbrial subunit
MPINVDKDVDMTIFTTMKLKAISSIMLIMAATSCPTQSATILQVTGNIKAAPCRVDFPTSGVELNIGQGIHQYVLATAGSGAPWVGFALKLKECPQTTTNVTMTVSGTPSAIGANTFINTGSATNAQIEVQNISDRRPLGNGAIISEPVDSASSTAQFRLKVRAYSISGNATPGTIVGSMQVSFTYQ